MWFLWLQSCIPLIPSNPHIPWQRSQKVLARTTKLPVTEPYGAERPPRNEFLG